MEGKVVLYISLAILVVFWLFPSLLLTLKISKTQDMPKDIKQELLKLCWQVPFLGNVVCCMKFAKIGRLRKLTAGEHKSLWVAYRSIR